MKATLTPQFAAAEDMASETLAIEREHDGIGLAIDSHTAVTRWEGERLDYDLAVGAMLRGRVTNQQTTAAATPVRSKSV